MTAAGFFLFGLGILAVIVANRYQWKALRELVRRKPQLANSIYGKFPGSIKWAEVRERCREEFPYGNKMKVSDYLAFAGMLSMLAAMTILLLSGRR